MEANLVTGAHQEFFCDDLRCIKCSALVMSRSRVVLPTWSSTCRILAIGEAPGETEDRTGEGFSGRAGKTLDGLLLDFGLRRGIDYGVANIVRCRPPDNRKPKPNERDACLSWLGKFLDYSRPSILLLVGESAASVFFGSGRLWSHIQRVRSEGAYVAFSEIAAPLKRSLEPRYDYWRRGFRCIPMPHTSGLAWNRRCPTGQRWSEIGKEMAQLAADSLRYLESSK